MRQIKSSKNEFQLNNCHTLIEHTIYEGFQTGESFFKWAMKQKGLPMKLIH
jgi:hypothetical protein